MKRFLMGLFSTLFIFCQITAFADDALTIVTGNISLTQEETEIVDETSPLYNCFVAIYENDHVVSDMDLYRLWASFKDSTFVFSQKGESKDFKIDLYRTISGVYRKIETVSFDTIIKNKKYILSFDEKYYLCLNASQEADKVYCTMKIQNTELLDNENSLEFFYSVDFEKGDAPDTSWTHTGQVKTGLASNGTFKFDGLYSEFSTTDNYIWYTNMPSSGSYIVKGTYGNYHYGNIQEVYLFFDSNTVTGMTSRPMFRLIEDSTTGFTRIILTDTWTDTFENGGLEEQNTLADFSAEDVGVNFVKDVNNVDFEIIYEDGYISLFLTNKDITGENIKNYFSTGKIKIDGVLNSYERSSNFGISGYPSWATTLRNFTVTTYNGWLTKYANDFTTTAALDDNWKLYKATALYNGTDKTKNPQLVKTGIATCDGQFTRAWYTNSAKADNVKINGTYMSYHGDKPTIDFVVNGTVYEGESANKHGEFDKGLRYRLEMSDYSNPNSNTVIKLQHKVNQLAAATTLATYEDTEYDFLRDIENVNFEITIIDNKMSLTLTDASDVTKTYTTAPYDISGYEKTKNVGFLSDNNYWFALRNLKVTSKEDEVLIKKSVFEEDCVTITATINTINHGSTEKPVVIAAVYDASGKIIGTDIIFIEEYGVQTIIDNVIKTTEIPEKLKLFLWEGLENIVPLCVNVTCFE